MTLDTGKLYDVLRRLQAAGGDNSLTEIEYKLIAQAITSAGGPSVADSIQLLKDRPISTLVGFVIGVAGNPSPSPGNGWSDKIISCGQYDNEGYLTVKGASFGTPASLGFTALEFPELVTLTNLEIAYLPGLLTVSFPKWIRQYNPWGSSGFGIYNNSYLTSISIPNLQYGIAGQAPVLWDMSGNTNLQTVDISGMVIVPGMLLTADPRFWIMGAALTQACVDSILVKVNSQKGAYVAGTVDLSGGTSAAPSVLGGGVAAKAALTTAGWTVNTN